MSINSIRLSAYGFRMEAVGSKKFIKRERDAFLEFAAGRVNETAQKLAEAVCAEPLHPFCNCAMPGVVRAFLSWRLRSARIFFFRTGPSAPQFQDWL